MKYLINKSSYLNKRFHDSWSAPLIICLNEITLSYSDFLYNAYILRESWAKKGIKAGDVICFDMHNSPVLLCGYIACALGRFICCPLLPHSHKDTKQAQIEIVNPKLIITELPELQTTSNDNSLIPEFDIEDKDRFLIAFTSGLTGQPKAILHGFGNIIGSAIAFATLSNMTSETRLYHILPMAYMAGILNTFFAPLVAGGTIIEGPLFSPAAMVKFWDRPLELKVNTLSLTPTLANALLKISQNYSKLDSIRNQIKQIQCTSAPLPLLLRKNFYDLFKKPLQNCYGMTEFGGPLTLQTFDDAYRQNDLSTPIHELEIDLRGYGEEKELWLKTPNRMLGYLAPDKSLELPIDEAGFMNSGDLAKVIDGKLVICGRKKDIIIRGGINISPTRIEHILNNARGIQEVAVVGIPHDFWGEQLAACIIPAEENLNLETELRIFCESNLAPFERPDRYIFLDSFPRNFLGKLNKASLRELAQAKLNIKQ